jgi:hypothetical protein
MIIVIKENSATLNISSQVVRIIKTYDYNVPSGITQDIFTAKGSLIAGTGAGTYVELPAGADGQAVLYDSSQASGMKAGTPPTATEPSWTNKSGADVSVGAVMVQDTTTDNATKTTTAANNPNVIGVTSEAIVNNAVGAHKVVGTATVQVTGAVVKGDWLVTSTTAERAASGGASVSVQRPIGAFAIALTANASGNGTVTALLLISNRVSEAPKTTTLWHDQSVVASGSAVATLIEAAQQYDFTIYTSSAANGDSWKNGFYLRAGTYTINILCRTSGDCGKEDIYVDDVLVATGIDMYSASPTNNVLKTAASVVVVGDGYHVLKGVVNGKNGSSSGYKTAITKIWFTPAAY